MIRPKCNEDATVSGLIEEATCLKTAQMSNDSLCKVSKKVKAQGIYLTGIRK